MDIEESPEIIDIALEFLRLGDGGLNFKFFYLFFFFLGIEPLADRARYEASLLVSVGSFKEPIFLKVFGGISNFPGSFEFLCSRCAKFLSSPASVLTLVTISNPSSV